jgi:Tol biopolymer transport system component
MICTHPAELISFSPDSRKVLFVNNNNYYIFTLKKEEADHTEEIGTKKVKNITKEDTSQISWLSNSTYLYYVKDNKLQISEKDGENQMELLDMKSTLLHTIMQNREYIITLENDPEKIAVVINQYRLK